MTLDSKQYAYYFNLRHKYRLGNLYLRGEGALGLLWHTEHR